MVLAFTSHQTRTSIVALVQFGWAFVFARLSRNISQHIAYSLILGNIFVVQQPRVLHADCMNNFTMQCT